MKVLELLQLLRKYPLDAIVVVDSNDDQEREILKVEGHYSDKLVTIKAE